MRPTASFWLLVLVASCQVTLKKNSGDSLQDSADARDTTPPTIEHSPVADSQIAGEPVVIAALVVDVLDESAIRQVKVHYKKETSTLFDIVNLSEVDPQGHYSGEIPATAVSSGGMDYFIEATDASQNTSWSPEEGEADPYHFRVVEDR